MDHNLPSTIYQIYGEAASSVTTMILHSACMLFASILFASMRKVESKSGDVLWSSAFGPGASGPPGSGQSDCQTYWGVDNAAPALGDGVVYLTSNYEVWSIHALNVTTGMKIWNISHGIATAPAVGEGCVYFAAVKSGSARLFCVDAATGLTLWDVAADGTNVHAPPVVADGMVFIILQGLWAFNATTGAKVWNAAKDTGCSNTSPFVQGGVVYAAGGMGKNGVRAFDAASGKLLWAALSDIQNPWASPVVYNSMVFISGFKTNYQTGTVYGIDTKAGVVQWHQNLTALGEKTSPLYRPYAPLAPAVAAGTLFVGGAMGTLYALDTTTGAKVWDSDTINPGSKMVKYLCEGHLWMVPAVADDVVYVGCDAGTLYALDAKTGAQKWQHDTGGHAVRSPVVRNGRVLFGVEKTMGRGEDDNLIVLET